MEKYNDNVDLFEDNEENPKKCCNYDSFFLFIRYMIHDGVKMLSNFLKSQIKPTKYEIVVDEWHAQKYTVGSKTAATNSASLELMLSKQGKVKK
ncbi:hypothetical protein T09_12286 [Trichinella sp. T9]|nr:hypothetical protein T09_12286 [Trichinella sp. T9]